MLFKMEILYSSDLMLVKVNDRYKNHKDIYIVINNLD